MTEIKRMSIADLAEDLFLKREHLAALECGNTPTDFDERKKAFVAMEVARAAAIEAGVRLRKARGE